MSIGSLISDLNEPFKDSWKSFEKSLSGKNSKDPVAHFAAATSVSPLTRALADKGTGGKFSNVWDSTMERIPDRVNENAAALTHGDVVSGTHALDGDKGYEAAGKDYSDSRHGLGQWVSNKPATTIGALITAAMFGGSALGVGAAGGESAPAAATPAASSAPASSAAPAGGTNAGTSASSQWQQYVDMFSKYGGMAGGMGGQGGGQQGQQAAPQSIAPPPSQVPYPQPAQNPGQLARTRLEASTNPSVGQLISNYGGGY